MATQGTRLKLLRNATADTHRRLEERLTLLDAGLDRCRYAKYLGALLSVVGPLERALGSVQDIESVWPDHRQRQKATWLRRDLRALGVDQVEEGGVFTLEDVGVAFGVGYVLEGSTLGGEVLRREIGRRLGPVPTEYFNCYGAELRARWLEFLAHLEAAPLGRADASLVEGAALAFSAIERTFFSRGLMR